MLRNLILAASLTGCTTAGVKHLEEPDRSQYYVSCIMHQVFVTTCECMEERAIEKTGVTNVSKLPQDQQMEFAKAIAAEYQQCSKELEDTMKDQLLPPADDHKNFSGPLNKG